MEKQLIKLAAALEERERKIYELAAKLEREGHREFAAFNRGRATGMGTAVVRIRALLDGEKE